MELLKKRRFNASMVRMFVLDEADELINFANNMAPQVPLLCVQQPVAGVLLLLLRFIPFLHFLKLLLGMVMLIRGAILVFRSAGV